MFNFKRFFLLTLSFIISLIIPRSKNIIVVGSRDGKRFADNSRYLFYYLNKEKKFKIIWLTKSKKIQSYLRMQNFEVLISNSAIGLYYGFRAKFHIFAYSEYDTSEFSSMRAHKINLGHGIYIKKVTSRVKNPNFLNLAIRMRANIYECVRTGLNGLEQVGTGHKLCQHFRPRSWKITF